MPETIDAMSIHNATNNLECIKNLRNGGVVEW